MIIARALNRTDLASALLAATNTAPTSSPPNPTPTATPGRPIVIEI